MDTKPDIELHEHNGSTGSSTPPQTSHQNPTLHNNDIADKDYALNHSDTTKTNNNLESGISDNLSPEHRAYLIERHGTADLVPMPTMDPVDPLNWPAWKKNTNLFLVSFHAMMTTFTAAAVIPVFEDFAIQFHISLTSASYLTSIQILILGVSPLFWKPISNRYGRRPIWLVSTLCSMVCNIGNAKANSYGAQIVARLLDAFFISPAIAISSAVVIETFFARERAQKMGIWTLMVTLGPPLGPFIMGFVAFHTGGWQWIYWTLAITNGVQFIAYFFLSPETLYFRNQTKPANLSQSPFRRQYLNFHAISPFPIKASDFWAPIKMAVYPSVLIPTIAYSISFNFTSVLLTVEIPQIFTPKFHFNAQQIGMQFLGMIIGSVIGEQIGGFGSDWFMRRASAKLGRNRTVPPEHRLWLSYPGLLTAIVGLLVFCIQTNNLSHYNVTPIIGIGVSAFGNQLITTVLVTYAVDCHHEHAASIGVFINLVRSTWGFIGPFWFPTMFETLGLSRSGGLMAGLMVATVVLPVIFVQWKGASLRKRREGKDLEMVNTITR